MKLIFLISMFFVLAPTLAETKYVTGKQYEIAEERIVQRLLKSTPDRCRLKENVSWKGWTLSVLRKQFDNEDAFENLGDGYYYSGGFERPASGQAFAIFDLKGNHGVIGILDCRLNSAKDGPDSKIPNDTTPWGPPYIVYLVSDFKNIDAMPENVRNRLDSWLKETTASKTKLFPSDAFKFKMLQPH